MPISPTSRNRTLPTPKGSQDTPNVNLYAVDFGTGDSLCIYGPSGLVRKKSLNLPIVIGGKTPRDEFIQVLTALLKLGDVVFESPTVGSSGAEVNDVLEVVEKSANVLWVVTSRAVKGYRMDNGLSNPKYDIGGDVESSHAEDAEIIYKIAVTCPYRLRKWKRCNPLILKYKSVRPMDKRLYRDEESNRLIENLPPFSYLPIELQLSPIALNGDYRRKLAIPFAQAMDEPFLWEGKVGSIRDRFQRIIGMYDHGYKRHYRRMFIDWMQITAKEIAEVSRMEEVSRDVRKVALKKSQRLVRRMFHLSRRWKLNDYPDDVIPKPIIDVPLQPKRLR